MITHFKTIKELVKDEKSCPLPLEVIPNYMGINLCSVQALSWQKQDDGQLCNLTIHFLPVEIDKLRYSEEEAEIIAKKEVKRREKQLPKKQRKAYIEGFTDCVSYLYDN